MNAPNGKTVLLVEDNEDNRIVYSTILRHFGYTVTEGVRTGNDTAEVLKKAVDSGNTLILGVGFAWGEEMGKSAAANPKA